MYWDSVAESVKKGRKASRLAVLGSAQYASIGFQAGPRPSLYVFPFWLIIAVIESGRASAR